MITPALAGVLQGVNSPSSAGKSTLERANAYEQPASDANSGDSAANPAVITDISASAPVNAISESVATEPRSYKDNSIPEDDVYGSPEQAYNPVDLAV